MFMTDDELFIDIWQYCQLFCVIWDYFFFSQGMSGLEYLCKNFQPSVFSKEWEGSMHFLSVFTVLEAYVVYSYFFKHEENDLHYTFQSKLFLFKL